MKTEVKYGEKRCCGTDARYDRGTISNTFFGSEQIFRISGAINPFTTGNPFSGTKILGFNIGRGSGALKGLTQRRRMALLFCAIG